VTQQIVGFVVTPQEIADRVVALDNAVRALDAQVDRAASKRVNKAWRDEFSAFERRWGVTRDSFASFGSRMFATRALPILEEFEDSYRWWARDFQRRGGGAVKGSPIVAPESFVPPWAWLAAAVSFAWFVRSKVM
jgi:hypothetical protein